MYVYIRLNVRGIGAQAGTPYPPASLALAVAVTYRCIVVTRARRKTNPRERVRIADIAVSWYCMYIDIYRAGKSRSREQQLYTRMSFGL